jgi:hypothetical protein
MAIKVTSTGQTTFVKKIVVGTPVRSVTESTTINSLTDVISTNTSNGQILIYDSDEGAFKNSDLIGGTGITSTYSNDSDKTTLSITNTGVTAGSYGTAFSIPNITINEQGQITAVAEEAVEVPLSDGTNTYNLNSTDERLTFKGSNAIKPTLSANEINYAIDSTADATLTNLTLTGDLRGPAVFTIDPAGIGDNTGRVVIAGDLQVDGTTTTINSTELTIEDVNIVLADGALDSADADGAGLTVSGANATFTYDNSSSKWVLNRGLVVSGDLIPNVDSAYDLGSNSAKWKDLHLSGSTIFLGGLKLKDSSTQFSVTDSADTPVNFNLEGSIDQIRGFFSAAGDLSYNSSTGEFTFDVEQVYTKANFDSDFNTALDEASINGNGLSYDSSTNTLSITDTGVIAGEYGSSTQIPVVTVNARGQIDSIGEVLVAGVTNFVWNSGTSTATISTADGGSFSAIINNFGDDQVLSFGQDSDLQIYYTDGTDTSTISVKQSNGVLKVQANSGFEDMAVFNGGGSVDLYHSNNKKFETKSTGVTVTGNLAANTITRSDATDHSGEYGSATQIPILTVDASGFIDSIGEVLVAGVTGLVYDSATGNLTISTADGGSFSDSINLSPFTTDNLSEGSNLYYTDTRVRNALSASGDLSYDQGTGQFSIDVEDIYTKANFDSDLGAALDGGTGITYDSSTDTISITDTGVIAATYGSASQIPVFTVNAQGQLDSAGSVAVAGVTNFAWDSSTSQATITTADGGSFPATINGFGNNQRLYFGDANDLQIYNNGTNSIIAEGGIGDLVIQGANIRLENGSGEYYLRTYNNGKVELYYDNSKKLETTDSGITVTGSIVGNYAGFDSDFTQKSTSDLSEGTNLYYTTVRSDSDFDIRLATKSTSDLSEGTNLYYTTVRVDSDIDAAFVAKSTDDLSEGSTNLYYTSARADSDAKNAISVTDNGGDGSLSYTPATGVISYTGPSASEVRAHFSGGTGVTITDGEVAIGQSVGTTDDVTFGAVTGDSAIFGEVAFNTSFHDSHIGFQEGALWYDPHHKNLNYYTDFDHPIEIGLQVVERVYNNNGYQINKGQPLYYSGNRTDEAGQESPTVSLANATSASKYNVQGLAAEDIPDGAYGQIVVAGVIDGFDTSGLTAGLNFFAGLTDGAVQNAAPTYPNYPMCLGWVIKSDSSDGKVIINQQNHSVNSFRVQGDTHISSDLRVDGDLIVVGTQTITSTANVEIGGNIQYLNAGDTIGEAGTTFVGSGLDDAFFAGHYSGDSSTKSFFVKIDATGGTDTFEWGFDSSVGTEATGIAITGSAQLLDSDYGIKIDFGATTGHTTGDKWTGTATATDIDTGFFTNRNTGDAGDGYTHIGLFFDVSENKWTFLNDYEPEPEAPINLSAPGLEYGTVKAASFEGNLTGAVTGNASTATTATNVTSTANNTANETVYLTFVDGQTGAQGIETDLQLTYNPSTNTITAGTFSGSGASLTSLNASNISSGTISDDRLPGSITSDITGNAATATALATGRTIDVTGVTATGQSFDGTASINIEVTAVPASLLTGTIDNARISLDAAEIPNLATSKITSGVFDSARIPFIPGGDADTLGGQAGSYYTNASNISSGTLASARLPDLAVSDFAASAIVTEAEGLASSDNDTSLPTTAAVVDYVANTAGGTDSATVSAIITADVDNAFVDALNVNAATVTATANNTANETVYLTFVDGATGEQGIETDTFLTYNPATNSLTLGTSGEGLTLNDAGVITANGNTLVLNSTSATALQHNGSTKLQTTSSGIDVNGSVTVGTSDTYVLDAAESTLSTVTQTAITTFDQATYGAAKFIVTAVSGGERHITEILVTHDGTTAVATEYGTVTTNGILATYDVDINGDNVRLLATGESATSTSYKVVKTLIEA